MTAPEARALGPYPHPSCGVLGLSPRPLMGTPHAPAAYPAATVSPMGGPPLETILDDVRLDIAPTSAAGPTTAEQGV